MVTLFVIFSKVAVFTTAKADLQEMRDFFDGWDPKLKTLLGMVQETTKWRLLNSEEMESWSHPSGKFALLGDACHATLPYLYVVLSFHLAHSKSNSTKKGPRGGSSSRGWCSVRCPVRAHRAQSTNRRRPCDLRAPAERPHYTCC